MTAIRPLVAGNWKMNGVRGSLGELETIGRAEAEAAKADLLICVPATLIASAAAGATNGAVRIGGQDCHAAQSGAHTGDISAEMIKDAGGDCVIVGHSERRTDHAESNEMVNAKAKAAWRAGLTAIICIGETQAERENGSTLDVLSNQIAGSVPAKATAENTVIAYEPVWAIGTGLVPTLDDVAAAHNHIRAQLAKQMGEGAANVRILYGGSVKPSNAAQLLGVENVNGALVGGASLKADDFLGIASAYL